MKHAREDYNRIQDPKGKIPKEEPVFLLRGQDKLAPGTVLHWAEKLESIEPTNPLIIQARDHALKMMEWQRDSKMKTPDPHVPEKLDTRKEVKTLDSLRMKYFVLKPHGSDGYAQASRKALIAYAEAIKMVNYNLAEDLMSWVCNIEEEEL